MDTTAIFSHLQNSEVGNTVFVLSNTLYKNITYIWSELSGVKLVYEPLSIYHPEYLALLSALHITIKCNNQDLLNSLTRNEKVVIGSHNITTSLIKSACSKGFQTFSVAQPRDLARIRNTVGDDIAVVIECSDGMDTTLVKCDHLAISFKGELETVQDIVRVGGQIHGVLEKTKQSGQTLTDITIGPVTSMQDIPVLRDSILSLKDSLPLDTTLHIELGQEVFQSTTLIATRILCREKQGESLRYEIDMSMYEEFAGYLVTDNNFNILSQTGSVAQGTIYGNTGDEEDVIFEGELCDLSVGDWILIGNAGLADCRNLEMLLLDEDLQIVDTVRPTNQCPTNLLDLETCTTLTSVSVAV